MGLESLTPAVIFLCVLVVLFRILRRLRSVFCLRVAVALTTVKAVCSRLTAKLPPPLYLLLSRSCRGCSFRPLRPHPQRRSEGHEMRRRDWLCRRGAQRPTPIRRRLARQRSSLALSSRFRSGWWRGGAPPNATRGRRLRPEPGGEHPPLLRSPHQYNLLRARLNQAGPPSRAGRLTGERENTERGDGWVPTRHRGPAGGRRRRRPGQRHRGWGLGSGGASSLALHLSICCSVLQIILRIGLLVVYVFAQFFPLPV
jgi:hypothetical protein